RRAAHHAGHSFLFSSSQRLMAGKKMAGHYHRHQPLYGLAVVDSGQAAGRLLDAQLVVMEYSVIQLAALQRANQHASRSAVVSMADMAVRPSGAMALAFMACRSAYMDTPDVCSVAPHHHAVSGRCLRT